MPTWMELNVTWGQLLGEIEEAETLDAEESGFLKGRAGHLKQLMDELQALEEEIDKKHSNPPDPAFADLFKSLRDRFQTLALSGLTNPGHLVISLQNRLWDHGISAIISFLERKAHEVGVESWSLGATAGFPAGVSSTITVHFRRSSWPGSLS